MRSVPALHVGGAVGIWGSLGAKGTSRLSAREWRGVGWSFGHCPSKGQLGPLLLLIPCSPLLQLEPWEMRQLETRHLWAPALGPKRGSSLGERTEGQGCGGGHGGGRPMVSAAAAALELALVAAGAAPRHLAAARGRGSGGAHGHVGPVAVAVGVAGA